MSTEKTSFLKRTGRFSLATVISRLTGLLRETTLAALFGASGSMDAFVAAFRIPNLLRDLFAEGALSAAYVPTFTEKLKRDGQDEAFKVTSAVFSILLVSLGIIVVLGIILAPYFVKYYVSGFADDPAKIDLTVTLTQIMFPFLLLVALAAASMGTLNSLGRFGIPAVSPAAFNIITIIAALYFSQFFNPPILVLGVGVVAGGLGQFAIQIPQLSRAGYKFHFRLAFRDPAVQRYFQRANYFGQTAELDNQGRVLIHQRLRESADMTGEVDIVGHFDFLQVWNHERLAAKLEREPFTRDDELALVSPRT